MELAEMERRKKEGRLDKRRGWSSQGPKEITSLKRYWNNKMMVTM